MYVIGIFVTVWFSLDTTAVVLAPIVYSLVRSLGLPALPFVFATTYVANTASMLLPVSNLTNLIVWNQLEIPFWHYAATMILPALLPVVVNLLFFMWLFRRDIPERFEVDALLPAETGPSGNGDALRVVGGMTATTAAAAPVNPRSEDFAAVRSEGSPPFDPTAGG